MRTWTTAFCAATVVVVVFAHQNRALSDEAAAPADAVDVPATARMSATSGLDSDPLSGPDDASTILRDNRQDKADLLNQNFLAQWEQFKADIFERTGFSFGADYTSVGFAATDSLGDYNAAGGIARVFGAWEFFNRGGPNTGSIEFKVEHRHAYTSIAPFIFGAEVGYAGTPQPVFNEDDFRTTTLYYRQNFFNDRALVRAGFLDIKEYFDVYALASPWTGFQNLAFSTGSNTMILLPDGALGVMAGGYLTDNFYAAASIVDASANPRSVFQGFETFFGDFDTFKTFEVGVTRGGQRLFLDNAHIAVWHVDDAEATGTPGGWGINASVSTLVAQKWLPFLRAGWANEGGGVYEASVSAGFGYMSEPGGNLVGVGVNWGRPNSATFPVDLDDQWTGEAFYRAQLTENIQITPSVQLLVNPALNPDEDVVGLFGLRGRVTF